MTTADYKHTVHIRQDAWFLRLYCWLWDADPSKVDVCKLFWGYVFATPNLVFQLLWLVIWPLRYVLRKANEADKAKQKQPKSKTVEQVPGRLSEFFARPWPRRISKATGIVLIGIVGIAVVGSSLFGLYLLVPLLPAAGSAVVHFLLTAEAVWIWCGVGYFAIFGLAFWLDHRFKWNDRINARKQRKHEQGEMTFGDVMVAGARAVKTNTCPRIEVLDRSQVKAPNGYRRVR